MLRRIVSLLIVFAGVGIFISKTNQSARSNPRDFQSLYAGAFCLTHHCNPYHVEELAEVLARQNVKPSGEWIDNLPIYPPTTLILFVPFSYLPIRAATLLWYCINLVAYLGVLLWLLFRSGVLQEVPLLSRGIAFLAMMLFPKAIWSISYANPNLLVSCLLAFAVFDDKPSREPVRMIFFALACLLKPQLGLPFVVILVLRNRPRAVVVTIACIALFAGFALLFTAHVPELAHWRGDIAANLAAGSAPGRSMDPSLRPIGGDSLLNLQYLLGYFLLNPANSLMISFLVSLLMAAAFLSSVWKARNTNDLNFYPLAVAALSVLTLLPMYHRFYDATLMMLMVPWLLRSLNPSFDEPSVARGSRRHRGEAIVALLLLVVTYKSWLRHAAAPAAAGLAGGMKGLLFYRYESLAVFLLGCFLLGLVVIASQSKEHLAS